MGILDFGFWGVWILDFGAGIPNPKSKIPKIQTFLAKFSGLWILDFGSLCSNSYILDFGGDFEFWILEVGDTGFWNLGILGSLNFGLRGF